MFAISEREASLSSRCGRLLAVGKDARMHGLYHSARVKECAGDQTILDCLLSPPWHIRSSSSRASSTFEETAGSSFHIKRSSRINLSSLISSIRAKSHLNLLYTFSTSLSLSPSVKIAPVEKRDKHNGSARECDEATVYAVSWA